ncbi:lipid IV(A) 3-deoxy-D-manno-octulosonic acid transferase [Candidatus Berkiella aquae]|uniref:3-deoxy-D-manno-octulosonic acid transferase n=1 Tax=Candidatus Berkiella aquae TaxID=295108 RepID=A0A0Q9YSV7_9GAMM|nr:lipid IV(A) 3-deoxy-D-manno-octulosonic acid transferase [Candidatus Berkiella aquae]MCS5710147.1 lipid IV(A) 3-deoxy-D-manno-octulosonic acid transferase [Candidatus Berkiella aquae]
MIWRIFLWVYTVLFTCLLPVVFFRLWVRSLRLPAYRRRWLERLGIVPLPPLEEVMWLHAVSVGEAIAAIPLVRRLNQQFPKSPILITTTTPTGSERVQAAFKDMLGKHIYHCYLPYDLPFTLNTFFKRIKPKLLILMETEIWPNLLQACKARQLPVLIANGRLSPVSMRRYQRLGRLMHWIVSPISAVAAQSAMDMARFAHLGVASDRISDTGNIKFDLQLPPYLQDAGMELRQELGSERLIWIAASTHETEEAIALNVYQALKARFPQLLLFLVPRHPDRFNKVAHLCTDRGFTIARRSLKQQTMPNTDIYLGDTMGELPLFYASSDVAFVGGSFVAVGGHNLLEPAALGLPVLSGPQLFNFVAISEMLVGAKGATIVNDETELEQCLVKLLTSTELRNTQGLQAKKVVEENKGALDKLLQVIERLWHQTPPLQAK